MISSSTADFLIFNEFIAISSSSYRNGSPNSVISSLIIRFTLGLSNFLLCLLLFHLPFIRRWWAIRFEVTIGIVGLFLGSQSRRLVRFQAFLLLLFISTLVKNRPTSFSSLAPVISLVLHLLLLLQTGWPQKVLYIDVGNLRVRALGLDVMCTTASWDI